MLLSDLYLGLACLLQEVGIHGLGRVDFLFENVVLDGVLVLLNGLALSLPEGDLQRLFIARRELIFGLELILKRLAARLKLGFCILNLQPGLDYRRVLGSIFEVQFFGQSLKLVQFGLKRGKL